MFTMPPDGNCLFHSLGCLLCGPGEDPVQGPGQSQMHIAMRQLICAEMEASGAQVSGYILRDYIRDNPRRKIPVTSETPPEVRIQHYGTDMEILMFARLFNCIVYVWGKYGKVNLWVPYGPAGEYLTDRQNEKRLPTFFLTNLDKDGEMSNHFNVCIV